jgi:hypothetical protein
MECVFIYFVLAELHLVLVVYYETPAPPCRNLEGLVYYCLAHGHPLRQARIQSTLRDPTLVRKLSAKNERDRESIRTI